MIATHTFHVVGKCPTTKLRDWYTVEITCRAFVLCETLVETAEALLAEPTYQETFTQALADKLGWPVVTTCSHLAGGKVKTRCACEPSKRRAKS